MKKKILNIVLAAAVTPFLCCCTDNFEEYNTNPYEPPFTQSAHAVCNHDYYRNQCTAE